MNLDSLWWRLRGKLDRYLDVAGDVSRPHAASLGGQTTSTSEHRQTGPSPHPCQQPPMHPVKDQIWSPSNGICASVSDAKEISQFQHAFSALTDYQKCKAGALIQDCPNFPAHWAVSWIQSLNLSQCSGCFLLQTCHAMLIRYHWT